MPIISPFLSTNEIFPEDETQLLIKHTENAYSVATAVNLREVAIYEQNEELLNGQQFSIPNDINRNFVYRKVFYLPSIITNLTYSQAHGITDFTQFTRMYGTCIATAPGPVTIYKPIPYISWLNVQNQIQLYADDTNFYVGNGPTADPILSGIIVLEYVKF